MSISPVSQGYQAPLSGSGLRRSVRIDRGLNQLDTPALDAFTVTQIGRMVQAVRNAALPAVAVLPQVARAVAQNVSAAPAA